MNGGRVPTWLLPLLATLLVACFIATGGASAEDAVNAAAAAESTAADAAAHDGHVSAPRDAVFARPSPVDKPGAVPPALFLLVAGFVVALFPRPVRGAVTVAAPVFCLWLSLIHI